MDFDKEQARDNYFEMIKDSWTYGKLTKEERERFTELLYSIQVSNCLKGNYKQRWEIVQAIYHSFLVGLNYNPINWREDEDIPLF